MKVCWVKMKHRFVAGFYLVLQLLLIWFNWGSDVDGLYVWYCNNVLLLFALSFYFEKYQVVKGLINVGFLAQLIWVLDVLSFVLFGNFLFGFSDYLFNLEHTALFVTTILIHVFSSFVALYFVFDKETKKESLMYSFFYVLALYFLVLLFTNPQSNVNCVFEICGLEEVIIIPFYTYLWPFLTFLVFALPTYYFQNYLSRVRGEGE